QLVREPLGLLRVQDVPAVALRLEPPAFGLREGCLRHAWILEWRMCSTRCSSCPHCSRSDLCSYVDAPSECSQKWHRRHRASRVTSTQLRRSTHCSPNWRERRCESTARMSSMVGPWSSWSCSRTSSKPLPPR